MGASLRGILEPLQRYSREPRGEPPELLPWASADPWALDGAARQALAMLVAGEQPGPRLFAVADYLLTFYTAADRSQAFPDALLLNGTALALCGYVCDGQWQEAHIWRLTGCARLATEVHARKAAIEDRVAADCLLAVCSVAEEMQLPLLSDLITLRERIWGRLLDHSRAEMLHVPEAQYVQQMHNPVHPQELGQILRARPWQEHARLPEYLLQADLRDADQTCDNLLTLTAHMLVQYQFGSEIDWHMRLFDDKESTVSINAMRFIRNLAAAYRQTGDDKYAQHAARLLWSYYNTCPVPNSRQIVGPWRTLEVGGRQWRVLVDTVGYLGATSAFDAATHAMLARSRLEHMRYLMAYCGGPNNWYQVEASGMAVAALFSPELNDADSYLRVALRRLKWINSFAYFDDGFQFELSHSYHMFPTSALMHLVHVARARGVALPGDFVALTEKAHEMYLYALQPNHLLPMFNDCGAMPIDPATTLRFASDVFARPDLRWGGSYGREGQKPDHASHAWPSAGYYAMRDRWGEDGQFLFFDGAPYGASHQHEDKLTFTLYAHGRLLIGDPNIYSYSWTEPTHYFKASRAHNLVMVDGRGQARRFRGEQAWLQTLGENEWVSRPGFDFVSSVYAEGFAPDPYPDRGAATTVDVSITHRRAMFYVKPGYWILCDQLQGPQGQAHQLEQLFHIAPVHEPGSPIPMRAGDISVSPSAIVTREAGLGNIAILPVDSAGLQARAQKGETSPAVGWYGVLGEFPAWDVTLQRTATLPARLDAVLFPLAPGQDEFPRLTPLRQDEAVTAFRIQADGLDDTFVLCEPGAGLVSIDDIAFEGRALLLRRRPRVRALCVAAVRLLVNGQEATLES